MLSGPQTASASPNLYLRISAGVAAVECKTREPQDQERTPWINWDKATQVISANLDPLRSELSPNDTPTNKITLARGVFHADAVSLAGNTGLKVVGFRRTRASSTSTGSRGLLKTTDAVGTPSRRKYRSAAGKLWTWWRSGPGNALR